MQGEDAEARELDKRANREENKRKARSKLVDEKDGQASGQAPGQGRGADADGDRQPYSLPARADDVGDARIFALMLSGALGQTFAQIPLARPLSPDRCTRPFCAGQFLPPVLKSQYMYCQWCVVLLFLVTAMHPPSPPK